MLAMKRPKVTYSSDEMSCNINDLCNDIMVLIFMFLKPEDKAVAAKVCRRWRTIADYPSLWRTTQARVRLVDPKGFKHVSKSLATRGICSVNLLDCLQGIQLKYLLEETSNSLLHLNVRHCLRSDSMVSKNFCLTLPQLKSLDLEFSGRRVSEKSFLKICKAVPNLKRLSLFIWYIGSIDSYISVMKEYLKTLECLELSIDGPNAARFNHPNALQLLYINDVGIFEDIPLKHLTIGHSIVRSSSKATSKRILTQLKSLEMEGALHTPESDVESYSDFLSIIGSDTLAALAISCASDRLLEFLSQRMPSLELLWVSSLNISQEHMLKIASKHSNIKYIEVNMPNHSVLARKQVKSDEWIRLSSNVINDAALKCKSLVQYNKLKQNYFGKLSFLS